MLMKLALGLAASLCLAATVTRAQTIDSTVGRVTNFPSKLFKKIKGQSASLNQQVTRQTEKYLSRMASREKELQRRITTVDSNAAKALFSNVQQQYSALAAQIRSDTAQRPVRLRGQYMPFADTLQGAMSFLCQHPQVLARAP